MKPRHIYRLVAVRVAAPCILAVRFDDGTEQIVDLSPILHGELFEPLRDPELFAKARLDPEIGTVVWPNGADLDPAVLHDWPEYRNEMTNLAAGWRDVGKVRKEDVCVAEQKPRYVTSRSKHVGRAGG